MFGRDSGDKTVLCPFDNTHVILAKSFNSHLVKCRKNNQHLKKVPCRFDRTHMVLKPELQHHHSVCPSRHLLDRDLQVRAGVSNTLKGDVSGPEIQSYDVDTEEDWDAAPKYRATNALFSRKKSYMDVEEEEEDFIHHTARNINYDPSAAAASSTAPSGENFRRVPLAPSKAAQLSGPVRPLGSSSQVYQYSVQQAALGLGRGRGRPSAQGAPTVSVVRPLANNIPQASVTASHLGRGIARFATLERQDDTATPPVMGRGVPAHRGVSQVSRHQQQQRAMLPLPAQFEDSEDVQAQQGGTSSRVETVAAPAVGLSQEVDESVLPLEEEMKALLLREELENEREIEELRQQQQRRHQQLVDLYRQKQIQQQPTTGATTSLTSGTLSPPPGFDTGITEQRSNITKGRGRGLEPSALRVPNSLSMTQGLQTAVAHTTDDQLSIAETTETSEGIKETEREDFSQMTTEKLMRMKRKLEKKMKQIRVLEKKVSDGTVLSPEEEAKLRKRDGIVEDLDRIGQYL